MSLRGMIAADLHDVFLDTDGFAEKRIIRYDGVEYDGSEHDGIPVVLSGQKWSERPKENNDHIQGLYLVTDTLRCALSDLGGKQPEPEQYLEINEPDDAAFFRKYLVVSSVCKFGMLRIELRAVEE